MKRRVLTSLALAPFALAAASCASSPAPGETPAATPLAHVPTGAVTALARDRDALVPSLSTSAKSSLTRVADVRLPLRADGEAHVSDVAAGMSVRTSLIGAAPVEGRLDGGRVLYPDALGAGAHLVHRVRAEGTEDYVVLPAARDALRWTVSLDGVAGLRLVEGVLELLDPAGTPRLRMEAPYVIDAAGHRVRAVPTLHGCAADTSPVAPWGRPVTAPGASSCEVSIAIPRGVSYPAVLDPSWMTTSTMVSARSRVTAILLNTGKVFLMGGFDGNNDVTNTAELFDPDSKTFAATASGKTPRAVYAAALLDDGRVLLAGGHAVGVSTATVEIFDPTSATYAAGPPLTGDRGLASATKLGDGRVLVIGGCTFSDTSLFCVDVLDDAQVYDPTANAWTSGGKSKSPRLLHATALLPDGGVLVVGGLDGAYDSAEIWKNGAFSPLPAPTSDVIDASATLTPDGKVVVAGGEDGFANVTGTTTIFDPATGKFTKGPDLQNPRRDHQAFVLTGGVTVVGGHQEDASGNTPAIKVPELLASVVGSWTPGPPMASPHSGFGGVVLPNGFLLVAGGEDENGVPTSVAELYGDTCNDDSMCGAGYCSPAKVCAPKKDDAATCTTKSECGSGNCVDGVCCDTPCLGQCQACDGDKKGTCAIVVGKPHGTRPLCIGDGQTCGGSCNGASPDCAFAGSSTACGTCSNGHAHVCDGKGTCPETAAKDCSPYVCGAADCTSTCSDDTGCAAGYTCGNGMCVPKAAATCDGDQLKLADGTTKSCAPYACTKEGVCLSNCDNSTQCSTGNTCNSNRVCAPPPAAPADGSSGGCGCTVPGADPRGLPGTLALLAALGFAVRRKRRG